MNMLLNKVRAEGNSVFIRSTPITGIVALTSFVDVTNGIASGKFFVKKFRYSLNGIIYTDWQDLTIEAITGIPVAVSDIFIIELRYDKNPVGESSISVTSATIEADQVAITNSELFQNSLFSSLFNSHDIGVLNWMVSVLEKLFGTGLLPNYIGRYNDNNSPEDFIEFWGAVCRFFSYYVIYARQYQNFDDNVPLLTEYLKQRGIVVSPENSLSELKRFAEKYYYQVASRGTIQVARKDRFGLNGELLRLLHFKEGDEFLFNLNKPEHANWNLNNASPLYRSLTVHDNLNKIWNQASEPTNTALYPFISGSNVAVIKDPVIDKNVLQITNTGGIGGSNLSYAIPVDPHMDYELSFFIRVPANVTLSVGLSVMDDQKVADSLIKIKDGSSTIFFVENIKLQRSDRYLYVRYFLYNKSKPINAFDATGMKLKKNAGYVIPSITVNGAGSSFIYNIRFLPLSLPYAKGFVQGGNWIDCVVKNRNHEETVPTLHHYITRYLIPYNAQIKITEVEKAGNYSG